MWNTGCASWYLDHTGRNATIWPDWTWRFRQRIAALDPAEYRLDVPARVPACPRAGMTRVLITGAAGGIGTAAAAELRARGAPRRRPRPRGRGDDVIACDVRDQASVDAAVAEAIERLGGLDVLINNAGIGTPQSAGAAPDDRRLAVIDVNLLGPWRVTAAALPAAARSRAAAWSTSPPASPTWRSRSAPPTA